MRAFVMRGIGDAGVETVADPVPEVADMVIAPLLSGMCGTDVHMYREGTLTRRESLPVVMGHEFVGEIADTNGHTTTVSGDRLAVGTKVVVEPLLPCGTCRMCLQGKQNLCIQWSHLGILRDGSWADLVTAPAARVSVVPDGVSVEAAALSEPLACAVNFVIHQGGLSAGESVLILGAGPIGLLCASIAKAAGARLVAVSEPQEYRRSRAFEAGADIVFDPSNGDLADEVLHHTQGLGFDLIVEATGAAPVVVQALEVAQPGSRVVLAGLGNAGFAQVDANTIVTKELQVRGGFASRRAMGTALSVLQSGAVRTDLLITSIQPWTEAKKVMDGGESNPKSCKNLFSRPSA